MTPHADTLPDEDDALIELLSEFLAQYGEALAEAVLPKIAECYAYPSVIITGEGSIVIAEPKEVEASFATAADDYAARGLVTAVPQIGELAVLGPQLVEVDVRWSYLDTDEQELEAEHFRYVVRQSDEHLLICSVIPIPITP